MSRTRAGSAAAMVDGRPVALTRCAGALGALENRCPHQGGPLGEGSIENGWLRCPWHGYDYDPITGAPARRASPTRRRPTRSRSATDGVYVELPDLPDARPHGRRRRWSRRWSRWGVTHVFGMVGHSNLGFADAMRRAEERGELTLHRHPPRGRGRVRGQRLRQAHRPPGRLLRDRRARAPPTCSPACTTPRSTAPVIAPPASQALRRNARQDRSPRLIRGGAIRCHQQGGVPPRDRG